MFEAVNIKKNMGSTTVLDDISFSVMPGEIFGLIGYNGVGKTTLLTLLCGLKKPKEGSILTDGQRPFDRTPSLLEGQYYLPDDVTPVSWKAREFALMNGKFWKNYDHGKFLEILQEFETDPDQKMNQMSSGQLKKTYISFALATGAKHLFMDEPTNGLDIPSKTQFRGAIMKHTAEDTTIIISTHQVRDLENIIDPIIILDKQDVLLNTTIEQITEKLYFDYGGELHSDALFSEQLPGGFLQVRPNTEGIESKVNVEALFNTVHRHKDGIKAMFAK